MGAWMGMLMMVAVASVTMRLPLHAQDAALRGAITRQMARLTGGEPKLDSVRMADLDGSGSQAAVATYTVFGPSSGYAGFMVFVKRASQWALAGNVSLGQGKVTGIRGRFVQAEELTLGPNDGRCCPSVRRARAFTLQQGRLVEVADANAAVAGGASTTGEAAPAPEPRQPFSAELREVRAGGNNVRRHVMLALRLQNLTTRPVVLAYEPSSATLTDDRGNRYEPQGLYGLGLINPPVIDPSFRLEPGQAGDVMLRFDWPSNQGILFGMTYDFRMPIRELSEVGQGQWRSGTTHFVQFAKLADGMSVRADDAPSPSPDPCDRAVDCSATGQVTARLQRSTTSMWGGAPYTRLDVRFRNDGSEPLSLCLTKGSPFGMDDRGNALVVQRWDAVRGIPVCDLQRLNTSFTVPPGGFRDASVEFAHGASQGTIRGQRASMTLAVRQLQPLPGNQVSVGRELAFLLRNVGVAGGSAAPPVTAEPAGGGADGAGTSPGTTPTDDRAQPDPCAELPNCYNAGIFTAQLTSAVASKEAGYRYLRLAVRIRNTGTEQRVLCFSSGTATAIDDQQNRYEIYHDNRGVRGFGVCDRNLVNPQFVVQPGSTRDGSLEFLVGIYTGKEVFGSTFNVTFALDELKLHPGNQVERLGQHVITFDGVSTERGKDGKKPGLLDALKKAVRKP